MSKMITERTAIAAALTTAKVNTVMYNKDDIPKSLPAAVVVLEGETGKNGTSKRYTDTDIDWSVFLIVNAEKASDPDSDLWSLKEAFRNAYIGAVGRDFPAIEYYTGRVDGARLVRIAKISLLRSGVGAGS